MINVPPRTPHLSKSILSNFSPPALSLIIVHTGGSADAFTQNFTLGVAWVGTKFQGAPKNLELSDKALKKDVSKAIRFTMTEAIKGGLALLPLLRGVE